MTGKTTGTIGVTPSVISQVLTVSTATVDRSWAGDLRRSSTRSTSRCAVTMPASTPTATLRWIQRSTAVEQQQRGGVRGDVVGQQPGQPHTAHPVIAGGRYAGHDRRPGWAWSTARPCAARPGPTAPAGRQP